MAMEEAGVRLAAENAGGFVDDMGRAHDAYGRFIKAVDTGAQKIPGASDIITGALRHMGTIAVDAALQAGKAVIGFVADSIKVAGDFEGGMNRFEAAVGNALDGSGVKLDDFKNLFLDLGAKLPVSTADVQEAAIALVKGGIDPLVVKAGGLESSLKFAAAAQMDLGDAAELSAKMLGSFVPVTATAAEKTEFLAKAQDLMVKAAGASTLDVAQLGDAMLQAGGQAKIAGVSYEDFVTTMGFISSSFGSAAEAGTSYKNFLARLQPTANAQKDAMKDLGLMAFDTTAAMKYLSENGVKPLGTDGMTLKQQIYDLNTSLGVSEKDTKKFLAAFDKSAFYDAQGNFIGMEKAAGLLKDATKDLTAEQKSQYFQTIFGNDAMGAAAALAQGGAEAYNKYAASQKDAAGVQANAEAMQKGYNTAMDNFKGSLEALQITIGSYLLPILTTLFNDYLAPGVNAIRAFADEFFKAPDKLAFLTQSITGMIPGLDNLQTGFNTAFNVIQTVIAALKPVVMSVFTYIQNFLSVHSDEILAIVKGAWELIQAAIDLVVGIIEKLIIPAFKSIAEFIEDNQDTIKGIFDDVWTVISTIIKTAITLITNTIKIANALIHGDIKTVWELIKNNFSTVWSAIKTIFTTALSLIANVLDLAFSAIVTTVATKMGATRKEINDVMDKVRELFGLAWEALKKIAGDALDALLTAVATKMGTTKEKIVQSIRDALDGIKGFFSEFSAVGESIINKIVEGIGKVAGNIKTAVWNAVKGALDQAIQSIKDFISNPLGAIGGLGGAGNSGGNDGGKDNSMRTNQLATDNASRFVTNNTISRTTHFNLSLATGQSSGSVATDFAILQALARG